MREFQHKSTSSFSKVSETPIDFVQQHVTNDPIDLVGKEETAAEGDQYNIEVAEQISDLFLPPLQTQSEPKNIGNANASDPFLALGRQAFVGNQPAFATQPESEPEAEQSKALSKPQKQLQTGGTLLDQQQSSLDNRIAGGPPAALLILVAVLTGGALYIRYQQRKKEQTVIIQPETQTARIPFNPRTEPTREAVQEVIQSRFPDQEIILPNTTSIAVLNGLRSIQERAERQEILGTIAQHFRNHTAVLYKYTPDEIIEIQQRVGAPPTGEYDEKTVERVIESQQNLKLKDDGEVGLDTYEALFNQSLAARREAKLQLQRAIDTRNSTEKEISDFYKNAAISRTADLLTQFKGQILEQVISLAISYYRDDTQRNEDINVNNPQPKDPAAWWRAVSRAASYYPRNAVEILPPIQPSQPPTVTQPGELKPSPTPEQPKGPSELPSKPSPLPEDGQPPLRELEPPMQLPELRPAELPPPFITEPPKVKPPEKDSPDGKTQTPLNPTTRNQSNPPSSEPPQGSSDGKQPSSQRVESPTKEDLDNYRAEIKVPTRNTIAVATANVPGLKETRFTGASPEVRREAGLPSLDEVYPNREIKSPSRDARGRNHAEEEIVTKFVEAVNNAGLQPDQVTGTLYIHQSNPRGFCTTCLQGINNPNVEAGILLQLSKRYPKLIT